MIPHAMSATGPYADLWSHLKSMNHALERVQAAKQMADIAELDKSRLKDLIGFLKQEIEQKEEETLPTFEILLANE